MNLLLAQIHLNEYSASNLNSFLDNFQKTEDWVELYNSSSAAVDLQGWYLSDKTSKPDKWRIPAGISIPANGFLRFWCSGRDTIAGDHYHTNFKLTQTKDGEFVVLARPDKSIAESTPLELTLLGHSRCRSTDGTGDWVIGINPSLAASNDLINQYAGYTRQPSMSLEGGFYSGPQMLSITNNEPNSVLRYTTNGHKPTPTSFEYTGPIQVSATQVVKARVFSNDPAILPGKIAFNTYFIDETFTLPVFSVAAETVIDLANGDGDLRPIGSLEYFNANKERVSTSYGELNRHGQDSWVNDHRSLDWVSRDEMGYSKAIFDKLFSYSDRNEHQRLMFRASGDDNYPATDAPEHDGSAHIRDEYVHTLALEGGMKLDVRAVERAIVFLNGRYWGVYGLRERPVDHDYTSYYYDQDKFQIQYLLTWGGTWAEYGGMQAFVDWQTLRDFIMNNDMSDANNYQVVKDNMQVLSLIDYMIANLNSVASDWLNYNTGWWRGLNPNGDHKKWGYILWDNDATFDYYINYSGVPNTDPDAKPCDINAISNFMDDFFLPDSSSFDASECLIVQNGTNPYPPDDSVFVQVLEQSGYCCYVDWDEICQAQYDEIVALGGDDNYFTNNVGKHEKIFLKLQEESEEFRQLYYSRQADLMNTVYSCENMTATLDRMLDVIEPEMPRQIDRWGGSMQEWQQNVAQLRSFIEERCTLLDDGMTDCFGLTGPYNLTLLVEPGGAGEIDLNTLDIEQFPWSGNYFGNMDNKIKARAFNENTHRFLRWESRAGHAILPDVSSRKATIVLNEPDTLIAVFEQLTSIKEPHQSFALTVYPSPADEWLTVTYVLDRGRHVKVSLFSVVGRQLVEFPAAGGEKAAGQHSHQLSLSSLAPGLYYLVVQAGEEQQVRKVTKM